MNRGLVTKELFDVFVLAGHAVFTLENRKTGGRFTFKIDQPDNDAPHFVSVLTGPDNQGDFTFLGTIFDGGRYAHGKKSGIGADAQSAKVFAWFWAKALEKAIPDQVEIYHLGRCGRCGRSLTVPESVRTGLGPKCRTM